MSTLTVGELVAYLDLDANPFTRGLNRAMTDAEGMGKKMTDVGGKMSKNITLPLLAAGGAAVKLGVDFDTAFSRMVGLAGVAADEVDGLKSEVLDLAGETAVAPQELADALYFAASAGLDAAGAMEATTLAAQASAAGMGKTADIVGLVASAVASYGEENITAAKATDILTAAVREGRADPEELAGTLGRVLPIAAQLGITFDEVGGAVAFLSNTFGDTNRTVTATQGLLTKLLAPSQQGRDALEEMGTSAEGLQAAIDKDGLLGAMELLREKGFDKNNEALAKLFDDMEGRSAALAIMGDESGRLAEILDKTANAVGSLDEAVDAAKAGEGFQMTQAMVNLQVAAIEAGDVIAPFVATVVGGMGDVVGAFSSLPGPAQNVVLGMAGILAATGPLLSALGKVKDNVQSVRNGLHTAKDAFVRLESAIGTTAVTVGVMYGVGKILNDTLDKLDTANLTKLENALLDFASGGNVGGEAADVLGEDLGKLQDAIEAVAAPSNATKVEHLANEIGTLGGLFGRGSHGVDQAAQTIDDIDKALASLAGRDLGAARSALAGLKEELGPEEYERLLPLLDDYETALAALDTAGTLAAGATDAVGGAADAAAPEINEVENAAKDAAEAIDAFKDAIDRAFAPMDLQAANDNFTSALQGMGDDFTAAEEGVNGAKDRLNDAQHALALLQAKPADKRDPDHNRQEAEARERIAEAERDLAEAVEGTSRSLTGNSRQAIENRSKLDDLVRAGGDVLRVMAEQGASEEELARKKDELLWRMTVEANQMGINVEELGIYKTAIEELPTTATLNVMMDLSDAEFKLRTLAIIMGEIEATGGVRPDASYAGPSYRRARGGPVGPGADVLVGEEGPELVRFGGMGHVFDAQTTESMLLGGGIRTVDQERALQQQAQGGAGGRTYAHNGDIVLNYPTPESDAAALERAVRKSQAASGL